MKELQEIYGLSAYDRWNQPSRRGAWPRNLRCYKGKASDLNDRVLEVSTFPRLLDVVSFLSVMNKTYTLLYRGQREDWPLVPALYRSEWTPSWAQGRRLDLVHQRVECWEDLESAEGAIRPVLEELGLPRWRPLLYQGHLAFRFARWAVVQHYELWPTPLLDFSRSVRVAASFAFDCEDRRGTTGMFYLCAVRDIQSNLMELREDGDDRERESATLAVRLNAVCPPGARRPHLQEGVLVGRYPFGRQDLDDQDGSDASAILVAKLKLVNRGGFWTRDFPIHTQASLLPEKDLLLGKLGSAVGAEMARRAGERFLGPAT